VRASSIAIGLVVLCLAAGCSSSKPRAAAPVTTTTTTPPPARVNWAALKNPMLERPATAVKDPALVAFDGGWVALYSEVDAHGAWRIGIARSTDLTSWSDFTRMTRDPTTEGEASPDVVRDPAGTYVVTYQSFPHDRAGGQAKLYARTTTDFRTFSPPIRLAATLHAAPADRLIDAALAWTPAGLLLGYKLGSNADGATQHFEIARSTSGKLDGPWEFVGRPNISVYNDTIENYQFIAVDGTWMLLGASNMFDRPELFHLAGNPKDPKGWLNWSAARELSVPLESWNKGTGATGVTYEHANCAYIVDHRAVDGHFYLVYSDSTDKVTFGGEGHAVVAIARSTDLVHWSVPPH